MRAELLNEATVVKGASFGVVGVWYMHRLARIEDGVPVHGYGIDVVETRTEAQGAQSGNAAGLEELADDAVGFCKGTFEEGYAER